LPPLGADKRTCPAVDERLDDEAPWPETWSAATFVNAEGADKGSKPVMGRSGVPAVEERALLMRCLDGAPDTPALFRDILSEIWGI
jgi:hypothetical protein